MTAHSRLNIDDPTSLGPQKVEFLEILDSVVVPDFELTESDLIHITIYALSDKSPDIRFLALKTIKHLAGKHPELGEVILTHTRDALTNKYNEIRKAALGIVRVLIEKCPDIIDAELINIVAQIAVTDKERSVRSAAQKTLETLAWSGAC